MPRREVAVFIRLSYKEKIMMHRIDGFSAQSGGKLLIEEDGAGSLAWADGR